MNIMINMSKFANDGIYINGLIPWEYANTWMKIGYVMPRLIVLSLALAFIFGISGAIISAIFEERNNKILEKVGHALLKMGAIFLGIMFLILFVTVVLAVIKIVYSMSIILF